MQIINEPAPNKPIVSNPVKEAKKYSRWLETYTKAVVTILLVSSLIFFLLSYILAFLDKPQIAESLSSTIATVIMGALVGYFGKALFETFFEKREERLTAQFSNIDLETLVNRLTIEQLEKLYELIAQKLGKNTEQGV